MVSHIQTPFGELYKGYSVSFPNQTYTLMMTDYYGISRIKILEMMASFWPMLCLIPRTTVTSLSAPKDTLCKTHPLCVNPGVPF